MYLANINLHNGEITHAYYYTYVHSEQKKKKKNYDQLENEQEVEGEKRNSDLKNFLVRIYLFHFVL